MPGVNQAPGGCNCIPTSVPCSTGGVSCPIPAQNLILTWTGAQTGSSTLVFNGSTHWTTPCFAFGALWCTIYLYCISGQWCLFAYFFNANTCLGVSQIDECSDIYTTSGCGSLPGNGWTSVVACSPFAITITSPIDVAHDSYHINPCSLIAGVTFTITP